MLNSQEEDQLKKHQFPPPPAYYKNFAHGIDAMPAPDMGLLQQTQQHYPFFGKIYPFAIEEPRLSQFGVEELVQVDQVVDWIQLMKKMNFSLLSSTSELLEYMVENVSNSDKKVEDINLLFTNFFFFVNHLRKKQAWLEYKKLLRKQIDERNEKSERIEAGVNEIKEAMRQELANIV